MGLLETYAKEKKRKDCCNFLVENNCMNLLEIFPTMPKTLLFKMNIYV